MMVVVRTKPYSLVGGNRETMTKTAEMALMVKVEVKEKAGAVQIDGLGKEIPVIPRQLQLQDQALHHRRLHPPLLSQTFLRPQLHWKRGATSSIMPIA